MTTMALIRFMSHVTALLITSLLVVGCESAGETPFGKPCQTGEDCVSGFCVGGEAGTQHAPFCSDDCSGKTTGDVCGDGRGQCIADFVSWCWMPCTTDTECAAINAERPVCSLTSSSGVDAPFKVCVGKPKS